MQERIDINQEQQNNFFLPQMLQLQQQKQRLRCPNNNQATSVCVSKQCLFPGLMCFETKCQCRKIHYKCHHLLIERVLESIERHQRQIPKKVKQTYKTIYDIINEMIEKLSKLRTKFQREEQYFGLREQQLQFMDLIYQRKTDQISGKIISSLEKTFDAEIQLKKNSKEDIQKDFESKRNEFDKLCKYIQQSYLQTQINVKKLQINSQLFKDSKIIQKSQQVQMLNKWLKQSFINSQQNPLKSKLLYRASQNNYSSDQFHNKCDGKNDTIVIVKNEYDKIIGGFTSIAWHTSGTPQYDKSDRSFMFSINLKEKYNYINKDRQSIYCGSSWGPSFGQKFDLYISNKCNNNQSSLGGIGFAYNIRVNNMNKYQHSLQQTKTLFTGNSNKSSFKIKQYQVYQITQ